jgi:5'-nucleotidase (lipoprotein e(P4) family)
MKILSRVPTAILLLFIILPFVPQQLLAQSNPEQNVTAVLWFQRSAEYRALCYQAFNLAELRIKEYLPRFDREKHPVVIFDIDETLLDNSPQEALNIAEGKPYSQEAWTAWTEKASAEAVPGAVEFVRFLAQNEIEPIYLSNRMNTEGTMTLLNLQKCNYPYADRNHLYLKSNTSSKEFRRNMVEKSHEVVMLVGDNLSDFDLIFEDRSVNFGYKTVDSLRSDIGKKFILLPNPMYGDWTKPLTGDRKSWLKK